MQICLCTQSFSALNLEQALRMVADTGCGAVELAACAPHVAPETLAKEGPGLRGLLQELGLKVAALSMSTDLADPAKRREEISAVRGVIGIAPEFGTYLVILTPGGPPSAQASRAERALFWSAMDACADAAAFRGVRIAVSTHPHQLTDTVSATTELLRPLPQRYVGVSLDFACLLAGGDDPVEAVSHMGGRLLFARVRDCLAAPSNRAGGPAFVPLGTGDLRYPGILSKLREVGYDGWLSIECSHPSARVEPAETARADYRYLEELLRQQT